MSLCYKTIYTEEVKFAPVEKQTEEANSAEVRATHPGKATTERPSNFSQCPYRYDSHRTFPSLMTALFA
jgi:hypothetical protein